MFPRLAAVPLLLLLFVAPLSAKDSRPLQGKATYTQGERVCKNLSLSALTGKSPLLVVGVGGAYQYLTADAAERERLGFFTRPWVWGTLLVIVLLVTFKDTILTAASYLKLPLNALGEAVHVGGGLFGLVYLGTVAFGGEPNVVDGSTASAGSPIFATDSNPTTLDQAGSLVLWFLMCAVHAVVWVVFNTVEVAILLNPFPFVDTALKSFRTAVIGVITVAAEIHPVLGFVAALPVILVCLLVLPVALRFALVGFVFTADVLSRLFGAKSVPVTPVKAFASWQLHGVRLWTFGTVENTGTGLEFVFRRFFLFTKRVPLPADGLAVSSGVITPALVGAGNDGKQLTLLRFPPRYNRREAELASTLGLSAVLDGSLGHTLGTAWRQVKAWVFRKKVTA